MRNPYRLYRGALYEEHELNTWWKRLRIMLKTLLYG